MITRKLKALLGGNLIALYIFLASCSSDNEPLPDITNDLLGSWDSPAITITELTVNEIDLVAYLKSIGYPDELASQFKTAIELGFTEHFEANLTFREGGVYEAVYENESLEGSWALTDQDRKIIFDEGTSEEYAMEIVEISSSKLEASVYEIDASEDYDGDGENDELAVSILLSLNKK